MSTFRNHANMNEIEERLRKVALKKAKDEKARKAAEQKKKQQGSDDSIPSVLAGIPGAVVLEPTVYGSTNVTDANGVSATVQALVKDVTGDDPITNNIIAINNALTQMGNALASGALEGSQVADYSVTCKDVKCMPPAQHTQTALTNGSWAPLINATIVQGSEWLRPDSDLTSRNTNDVTVVPYSQWVSNGIGGAMNPEREYVIAKMLVYDSNPNCDLVISCLMGVTLNPQSQGSTGNALMVCVMGLDTQSMPNAMSHDWYLDSDPVSTTPLSSSVVQQGYKQVVIPKSAIDAIYAAGRLLGIGISWGITIGSGDNGSSLYTNPAINKVNAQLRIVRSVISP